MMYSSDYLDIAFEDSPWEQLLSQLKVGDTLSAARLLAALDGENEDVLEDAFAHLQDLAVTLDISDLPKPTGTGEAAVRLRFEEQLSQKGSFLQELEDSDPLRLYLEELAMIPVQGDIRLLAEELEKANREEVADPQLWTKILNLSLSRVVELARAHTGRGVLLLDLIQEGSMDLWQSFERYDGGDFESFRDWHIRQAMARVITLQALSSGVGQKMRQALEDYRSVDERLLSELGRNPTLEEIAEQLHMTPQQTAVVADMLSNARTMSKAKSQPEPEEPDPDDANAVEDTAYFQMRQRISELLSGLSDLDAQLLNLRFGLEGGLPMKPEEVGAKLGLTPAEVVAREAAALAKLREKA